MKPLSKCFEVASGLSPVALLLLTAATYGSAIWAVRPWFGFTVGWLTIMMQIEFLVIHSFAFIMIIAWLKPKTLPLKVLRWTGFLAFAALYVYAALEFGMAYFVVLAAFEGVIALGRLFASTRPERAAAGPRPDGPRA